ncbi:hypothetical protein M0811_04848 [Anaeramoeba ignava]|uniref:Uncharacterized protein n=1 Tax=Anaeramoeba ignava TaxID=1746090 RepID=A0A9Q0RG96_ANAIG|nr:hypothetical protein M0811_04848 [Anaeramoeba ignava]
MQKKVFLLIAFFVLINQIFSTSTIFTLSPTITWRLTDTLTPEATAGIFASSVSTSENFCVIGDPVENTVGIFENNGTNFVFLQALTGPQGFGSSVSISGNFIVIGAPISNQSFVFKFNGSYWDLNQQFGGPPNFGVSVSISDNFTVIGSDITNRALVFHFNGSGWDALPALIGPPSSSFGSCVSISKDLIAISAKAQGQIFVYRFNAGSWTLEQNLQESTTGYGSSVAVSENIVVGAPGENTVYIYNYVDLVGWSIQKQLTGSGDQFGTTVAISSNVTVIGTNGSSEVFVYRFNVNDWDLEKTLSESPPSFGSSISISEDQSTIISGAPGSNEAFVFLSTLVPSPVTLINCTSLFSSFQCFWEQVEFPTSLDYQINYGVDFISIQSPIFDGNVFNQIFNSSLYVNITGNDFYSISIRACDPLTQTCGNQSQIFNLTTRIDSVKNFNLTNPTNDSIDVSFDPPNVKMDNEIPHLDHYVISYFKVSDTPTNVTVSNSSNFDTLDNLVCKAFYQVSMWSCRTPLCEGDDQGEAAHSAITTLFGPVSSLHCSVSNVFNVSCSWNDPGCSQSPNYYNFSYDTSSQDDSGNTHPLSTNVEFTAQFPNQEYQVSVSVCDSDNVCVYSVATSITTDKLPAPTIYGSIPKIEEVELNFTKLAQANKYIYSDNNGVNWKDFTSINLIGNEVIGTISGLSGNVQYQVSVRACFDSSCENQYLGLISETVSIKAKLGNITSFDCIPTICGFNCTWDPLTLSTGLEAYSLNYNSTSICLLPSKTNYSISGLIGGENYQISIYSSADSNCSFSDYSGINSTTSITTDKLPAPTIYGSISQNRRNFTSINLSGNEVIGTISGLSGNVQYQVSVRGCTDSSCENQYLGLISETVSIKAKLGNITSFNCIPTICGFNCTWDPLTLSTGLEAYSLTYNSTSVCLLPSKTNYSISGLIGGENYQISIYSSADSNCSFNDYSGINSTTSIITILEAPTIYGSISKIEEVELNFTKLTQASKYIYSDNNGVNWKNFTSINLSGNEVIGTISGLSGNVQYQVSVRGCSDSSCESQYLGAISETVSIKAKLGNITSFNCIPTVCGFNCTWDPLLLSTGLEAYSLTYNSTSVCLLPSKTNYSISGLIGGENYQISIYSSADSNCSFNDYSGINSTKLIFVPNLEAPTIYGSISKIEEVELNFTKLEQASKYIYSDNNGVNWKNFTSINLSGNEVIGTISGLSGNVQYQVSVRGCTDSNCESQYLGLISETVSIKAKLGNITSFNCIPTICGFNCTWDSLTLSTGLEAYSLTYNSTSVCLLPSKTNYSISGLIGGEIYQISIYSSADSNCSFNDYSGINSTTSITTDKLPAPTIYGSISKIEEVELNFTKLTQASKYIYSDNNGVNWKNFTSINLIGNEVIGTISGLSGNVQYQVSVRGCTDSSCESQYLGLISETVSIKAKLGNITSFNCIPTICGFNCTWDSLTLSTGLEAYSLTYNSTSVCLLPSKTNYSISGLIGGENYQISIYSSADSNCSFNDYSGINSTTSIITILEAPTIYGSISKIEEVELNFTKLEQASKYIYSDNNGVNWKNFTSINLIGNEVIGTISGLSGNVQYQVSVRGCTDSSCESQYLGAISETVSIKAKLGNITSFNCIPTICGFNCTWDPLLLSTGLEAYSLTYNSTSICLLPSKTNYSISGLIGGEIYQISIYSSADSNCSFNDYSGINSTTSIITILEAPTIYGSISKIEEVELNFTKLTQASKYIYSDNNGVNWKDFTSINLSGNEVIGTISGLSGNVQYQVSVRGCSDSSCESQYLGAISETVSIKAKLGNITSFDCIPTLYGFNCTWDPLTLSTGLEAYSLTYNSKSVCLLPSKTNYSISGLIGGENYQISIYSSADSNCSFNDYSGINSTTSIRILSPTESNNDSSQTTAIIVGIIVPILAISTFIVLYALFRRSQKSKRNSRKNDDDYERELQADLDI